MRPFPQTPFPQCPTSLACSDGATFTKSLTKPNTSRTIKKPASLRLWLICLRFDARKISTVVAAGELWKIPRVLLEARGEPAGTNFASLTRDVFRRASTGGMPGFPNEFSDVV